MAAFRCKSCDRALAEAPAPGQPCPTCGAELAPERPLELDPAWEAERAAKAAAAAAPPPAAGRWLGRGVLILTSVVMVAVAVVMVFQRQPTARGEEDVSDRVELTITAPRPGTPVTIDGVKVGTTPLSIKVKGPRTRPMRIEGGGVAVDITPDRDRVVNLARRK